jgi:hypothetical protein
MSNGTVDSRTFWTDLFNSAEKDGETLRVGEYRSAPIGRTDQEFWAVLKDDADYAAESFKSEQLALDWMVAVLTRQRFWATGAQLAKSILRDAVQRVG